MKKNKIVALVMTGLLTVGIISGCGSKTTPDIMANTLVNAITQDDYKELGVLIGEDKATQVNKTVEVELKETIKSLPGSTSLSEEDLSNLTGKMKELIKGITFTTEERIKEDSAVVEIVMESKDISEVVNKAEIAKDIAFEMMQTETPGANYKLIDTKSDLVFFDIVGNEMVNAPNKQIIKGVALEKEKKEWKFEDLLSEVKRIARDLISIY